MFINNGAQVGNSGNTKIRFGANGFIAVQTGTYQEQYLRPFNPNTNEKVVSQLREVTRNGLNLGVGAVQEVAADVISPQAMVEAAVKIPEGFTSRRFRIMCRVFEENPFIKGTTTQRIFYGYSDHCEATLENGLIDPKMRIYFNSETIVAESIIPTPNGPQTQAKILGSNQIISPVDLVGGQQNGMFAKPSSFLIRPEDNFNLMQTKAVADNLQRNGLVDVRIDAQYDHRSMVGEGGAFKYSNRRDTSPVRYLSNSLNAYQHARKEYNNTMHDTNELAFNRGTDSNEVLMGEASSVCRNSSITHNTFLSILRDHTGFMEVGYVTWGQLRELFPELNDPNCAKFALDNGRSIRNVSHAGQSQYWNGADYTSIGASLLAQTIPAIMMDNFFRGVSFAVTNGNGPNEYIFDFHTGATYSIVAGNFDMTPYLLELERRIKVDVLNSISRGNQLPFKISMISDLAGESIIDISIGNEPVERFVAPTFSDSLFSPVITRNQSLSSTIADDITWLVKSVIDGDSNVGRFKSNDFRPYEAPVAPPVQFQPNANKGVVNNVADLGLL